MRAAYIEQLGPPDEIRYGNCPPHGPDPPTCWSRSRPPPSTRGHLRPFRGLPHPLSFPT
ncbi:hypothetical protein NKH77_14910 [Streptomyces sp. M19]